MNEPTTRELLVSAAQAAGIDLGDWHSSPTDEWFVEADDGPRWNPMDFDGDAFRLAAKLEMRVTFIGEGMCEVALLDTRDFKPVFQHVPGDTETAARKAIVLMAAAMGGADISWSATA